MADQDQQRARGRTEWSIRRLLEYDRILHRGRPESGGAHLEAEFDAERGIALLSGAG